jgi:hypothetical protein
MYMQQNIEQRKKNSIRTKKDRTLVVKSSQPTAKMLPAMEIDIEHIPFRVEVSYERLKEDVLFRFRFAERAAEGLVEINAFSTRETFLQVRTPGEALDFLSGTGRFRSEDSWFPKRHENLSWSDFQRWQQLVRILMQNGRLSERAILRDGRDVGIEFAVPEELRPIMTELSLVEIGWLGGHPHGLSIHPILESNKSGVRNKLTATIFVHSTLEAILAAIYLDSLNGVQYGRCEYCHKLFEIRTRRARAYCTLSCAQKAGVRRRRAEARAVNMQPSARKTKDITRKGGK